MQVIDKNIDKSSIAGVIKRSFDRPVLNWIKHIVFPDFQRPYCWTMADIQKILDDIDELRYSPESEQYREEDEYYLGAICVMAVKQGDDPDSAFDMALLDGQQRMTSLMILAHILFERAMASSNPEIIEFGRNIDREMGGNSVWKQAFLYREPVTRRRIREVYRAIDSEYQQLERDSALDFETRSMSFYEETLLRDLKRFRYLLVSGRVAVTVLSNLREAEQYFQGENNRGLPMSLLDILKAYHMRFEASPEGLEEIRKIWDAFNIVAKSESDAPQGEDDALFRQIDELAHRKQAVEAHVIPALLMRCGIAPWTWSANIPQNANVLKGIIGTHRGDRIVDDKLSASNGKHLFDLLEPVETGIGFFRMLDQYRRIDGALDLMESREAPAERFNPGAGLYLNNDQQLILRLALMAWTDRFALRSAFKNGSFDPGELADVLISDAEFRAYARYFARFLKRLRNEKAAPGAFRKLKKTSLLRCIRYWDVRENLILLPHRSATPAACRRDFLSSTTPEAMMQLIGNDKRNERYRHACDLESGGLKSCKGKVKREFR